ncbi:hypothetical protein [Serratia fonticola]
MNKLVEMIGNGDVAHFQKQAAHRIWEGEVVEAARKIALEFYQDRYSCVSDALALIELFKQEPEKP